jgi:hypothetical protein
MKKTMTKSALLFASIMALAAFAMPSMASAATWGPNTFNHTLTGSFIPTTVLTNSNFICNSSLVVHARVPASSTLDITSATFSSCHGNVGIGADCNVTAVASGLPWTANGTSTSDVQINITDIAATYSNDPAHPGQCTVIGRVAHLSGTLTGGAWTAANHKVTYASDPGLSSNDGFGTKVVQTTWGLTDSGVNPLTLS